MKGYDNEQASEHKHHEGYRQPDSGRAVPSLQRQAGNTAVADLVRESISGAGRPLDDGVREEMEGHFGQPFDDVRIHTGPTADRSAGAVEAHAYTVGSHIVFRDDADNFSSSEGKRLLAHELTHVVQQRFGRAHGSRTGEISISHPGDDSEQEAERIAGEIHPSGKSSVQQQVIEKGAGPKPLGFPVNRHHGPAHLEELFERYATGHQRDAAIQETIQKKLDWKREQDAGGHQGHLTYFLDRNSHVAVSPWLQRQLRRRLRLEDLFYWFAEGVYTGSRVRAAVVSKLDWKRRNAPEHLNDFLRHRDALRSPWLASRIRERLDDLGGEEHTPDDLEAGGNGERTWLQVFLGINRPLRVRFGRRGGRPVIYELDHFGRVRSSPVALRINSTEGGRHYVQVDDIVLPQKLDRTAVGRFFPDFRRVDEIDLLDVVAAYLGVIEEFDTAWKVTAIQVTADGSGRVTMHPVLRIEPGGSYIRASSHAEHADEYRLDEIVTITETSRGVRQVLKASAFVAEVGLTGARGLLLGGMGRSFAQVAARRFGHGVAGTVARRVGGFINSEATRIMFSIGKEYLKQMLGAAQRAKIAGRELDEADYLGAVPEAVGAGFASWADFRLAAPRLGELVRVRPGELPRVLELLKHHCREVLPGRIATSLVRRTMEQFSGFIIAGATETTRDDAAIEARARELASDPVGNMLAIVKIVVKELFTVALANMGDSTRDRGEAARNYAARADLED